MSELSASTSVSWASDYRTAVDAARSGQWDMVIVDLTLPGLAGMAGIVGLLTETPDARWVALANGHGSEILRLCRICGLDGLVDLPFDADHVRRVMTMVMRGGLAFPDTLAVPTGEVPPPPAALTPKQLKVMARLADGLSNKQIAKDLELSPNTVKAHVSEVLRRLGVGSRSEAIVVTRAPLTV